MPPDDDIESAYGDLMGPADAYADLMDPADVAAPTEEQPSAQLEAIPQGYRETGRRSLTLPTTRFEVDVRNPRRSRESTVGQAVEEREIAKVDPSMDPRRSAAFGRVAPDERGVIDRLSDWVTGQRPLEVGGMELPTRESLGRAWEGLRQGGDVGDAFSAAFPNAAPGPEQRGVMGDQRSQAGWAGLGEGLTLGWADEMAGRLGGVLPHRPWLGEVPAERSYEERRDAARDVGTAAQEQAPGTAMAGAIAGSLPLAALPAAGASSWAGRAALAGLEGGALGGAYGAGQSEEEGAGGVLWDAAVGAGTGLAAGAGLSTLGSALGGVGGAGEYLGGLADRLRTRAAGVRYAQDVARIPRDTARFAQDIRETGVSRGLSSVSGAGSRAARVRERAGEELSALSREADEAARAARSAGTYREGARVPGTARLEDLRAALGRERDRIQGQAQPSVSARSQIDALVDRYAEAYPDGAIPLSAIREDWLAFGNPANFRPDATYSVLRDSAQGLRRAFREAMEGAMESASGPEARERLSTALRQYHMGRTVARGAERMEQRAASNRLLSPTDYVAMGIGGISGALESPVAGGAAALAGLGFNRVIRGREHAIGATALEAIAPRIRRFGPRAERWAGVLESARGRGPTALAAAHYMLSRREPEYRAALRELERQDEDFEEERDDDRTGEP